jgi:tetratricopeptide (TPR) repeat protein
VVRGRSGGVYILAVFALSFAAHAQERKPDLDEYYRFPASIGVDFQQLSPFNDYSTDFNATELAVSACAPLPFNPSLQPFVRLGVRNWDYVNNEDPGDRWEHRHWFGQLGLAYAHRVSREFEVGASGAAGLSEAIFPNLDKDPVTGEFSSRSNLYLLATAAGKLSLNPSFSIGIEISPSLSYQRSFTPLDRYDGFVLGLGIGAHYRFGEDPDAPQAIIRSLRTGETAIPPVYAAMQSYYVSHPIATIALTNIESFPIRDVEVAFYQEGFMDNPTPAASVAELGPGKTTEVKLLAAFNSQVFSTEGVTPLNGEIRASYVARNRPATQAFPVTYDLQDRTAITWDDDRKFAAFITQADGALRNLASYVRQAAKDSVLPGLGEPLQIAMQIYYALKELGVIYQADPTSPFGAAQANASIVDSVSLPRDTLRRGTGDCDDLTALFDALLETVGVETGYITTPGHIFPMINTKTASRDYEMVNPEQSMSIDIDGELWIPVEITFVANNEFAAAWRSGIEIYRQYDGSPDRRGVHLTRRAQEAFRPVGLRETDAGIVYPRADRLFAHVTASLGGLIDTIVASASRKAQESNNRRDFNSLGIVAAQLGRYDVAERAFNAALALDRNYTSPLINLGNLYFVQGRTQDALRNYHRAERDLGERERTGSPEYAVVLLNICRAYHKLENHDRAEEYYGLLVAADPRLAAQNTYLGSAAAAPK